MKNIVYIATSLDGYIADKNGSVDWLNQIDNPTQDDMGFQAHMDSVDALIMGRNTLDVVLSFGVDWPYNKPVFVLSNKLKSLPQELDGKVFIVGGAIDQVLSEIHNQGYKNLYIDGGNVIQQFLAADLIDEMVISTVPVLLGGGAPLFADLPQSMLFECVKSDVYLNAIVQTKYRRKKHD